MSIYFVWFLIYDIDAIFRFIGPTSWLIYPFDWVIFLCFAVNLVNIIYLYPRLMRGIAAGNMDIGGLEISVTEIGDRYDLTNREKEILFDMALGKDNSDIASHYVISIHTVKRHINNIYRKSEKHGRKELVREIRENLK
jgi:DNA-binding NarL/FixJ family response regulator